MPTPFQSLLALSALALSATPAAARDVAPEGDTGDADPAYIVNGNEESGFPSAVAIGLETGPYRAATCSSSLITPRILLTAAHCTEEYVKQGVSEDLIVQLGAAFFGKNVDRADAIRFADFVNHPDYRGITGAGTPENDFGVVVLEEDVTDVEPVWFNTEKLRDADIGTRLTSVGYGITSAATQAGSGTKRSAKVKVSELDGEFIVSYTRDNPGNGNVCSGDSGGPQYYEREDGTLVQWSVHSWADQNCQVVSGSSRTDVGKAWILAQVEAVHGTSDVCVLFGKFSNGVCDADCDTPDPECAIADGGGSGDGAAGGGDATGEGDTKACGCAHADPGAAFGLLPLALILRRRRR
jgi:MYXO-CTERM domain-containing protein